MRLLKIGVLVLTVLVMTGCSQTYYKTMETFGVHKREILVDRVEEARDSQVESKEQFESALERFKSVINFDGKDLEDKYNALNKEYQKSEAKAEDVRDRINAVEDVSEALFDEWEDELDQYSNDKYRRIKAAELKDARKRYTRLIASMRKAEKRMAPVLATFKDQVLFLKHSLNAQAVASLKSEMISVQADIKLLIREMQKSIDASNAFIKSLQ